MRGNQGHAYLQNHGHILSINSDFSLQFKQILQYSVNMINDGHFFVSGNPLSDACGVASKPDTQTK